MYVPAVEEKKMFAACNSNNQNVDTSNGKGKGRDKTVEEGNLIRLSVCPTWLHHCQWSEGQPQEKQQIIYACERFLLFIDKTLDRPSRLSSFSPTLPPPPPPLMQTHIHISNWSNRAQTQYQATPTLFPF